MKSSYTINENGILIRPMLERDINAYLSKFNFTKEKLLEYRRIYKEIFKNKKDDDPDMYFVVLKKDKIIGEISAKALEDSICDALIRIVLPKNQEMFLQVKNTFITLCRNTYIYDDIYIVPEDGNVRNSQKVLISKSSRWEVSE